MPPTTPNEARAAEILSLQDDIEAGEALLAAASDAALKAEIDQKRARLDALLAEVAPIPPVAAPTTSPAQEPTSRGPLSRAWGVEAELDLDKEA